LAGVAQR